MKIQSITVGAFQENCYLVVDDVTNRAVLVDPGAEPDRLIAMVRESGATLEQIWLTHGHIDHIGGVVGVRRVWPVPVHLHPFDMPLYERGAMQAAYYGIAFDQPPAPDRALADDTYVMAGELPFRVMHTPGHSPGHVIFVHNGVVLGGDLLFAGSIGRTDLPLSDPVRMEQSLERICALEDDTVVYPGHGPATSLAAERMSNPFLNGVARVLKR